MAPKITSVGGGGLMMRCKLVMLMAMTVTGSGGVFGSVDNGGGEYCDGVVRCGVLWCLGGICVFSVLLFLWQILLLLVLAVVVVVVLVEE